MIELAHPIVAAPMAGGASTPELAAAVGEAGGLGFLAAGYKTPEAVREEIAAIRSLTARPFGVNIFAPPGDAIRGRSSATRPGWRRRPRAIGITLGRPRHDDDGWEAKLELVVARAGPGRLVRLRLPAARGARRAARRRCGDVGDGHDAGRGAEAARAGADALVVQGVEAGAHRGSFDDAAPGDIGLLALLQLVRAQVDLPMVAAGGIATGARRGRGARGRAPRPPRWGRRSCARARPGRRRCTARRSAPTSRPR